MAEAPKGSTTLDWVADVELTPIAIKGDEMHDSVKNGNEVGFIGLGHLGGTMASRLVQAGHQLVVFDQDAAAVKRLEQDGAKSAGSAREVAERAEVVFSCLPSEDAARAALIGDEGAASGASERNGFVECSTVAPETARALADELRRSGALAIDASVSGSTIPAQKGELVLLVGGDRELYERCESLFEPLAKATYLMGESGAGATTKLVVNTLLGVNMQALAEAIALGLSSGLDREKLLDVLQANATIGEAHRPKIDNVRNGEYPAQFALRLMHKDFGLIIDQAQRVGAAMPATAVCHQLCSAEAARGQEEDFSAVARLMLELSSAGHDTA
jgi:3-hydroxyisobutyrate dehydrogenase-like beta-hydroxyacid dehydrogenase